MFNFKFLEKFENFNEKSGGADYNDDNLHHGLPSLLLQVEIFLDKAAVAVEAEVVAIVPQHPHHANTAGEKEGCQYKAGNIIACLRGKQNFGRKKLHFKIIFCG